MLFEEAWVGWEVWEVWGEWGAWVDSKVFFKTCLDFKANLKKNKTVNKKLLLNWILILIKQSMEQKK